MLRIDHISLTPPFRPAKPVIDVQVEVTSPERVRMEVVPVLEADGHEFIWRPTTARGSLVLRLVHPAECGG